MGELKGRERRGRSRSLVFGREGQVARHGRFGRGRLREAVARVVPSVGRNGEVVERFEQVSTRGRPPRRLSPVGRRPSSFVLFVLLPSLTVRPKVNLGNRLGLLFVSLPKQFSLPPLLPPSSHTVQLSIPLLLPSRTRPSRYPVRGRRRTRRTSRFEVQAERNVASSVSASGGVEHARVAECDLDRVVPSRVGHPVDVRDVSTWSKYELTP